jgi:amino acid adenylation domain-containing protein
MKELLEKAVDAGLILDVVDGKLKLYTQVDEIDPVILNEIKTKKEEITEFLVKNEIAGIYESDYEGITPVPHSESYPISHAQRRLWILSQFEQGAAAFNLSGRLHLNKGIDLNCFKKALKATIDRHEILRTVFRAENDNETHSAANLNAGEVRQWVISPDDFEFEVDEVDFRNQISEESLKMSLVQAYIDEDVFQLYDLQNGPLFRVSLLQLADQEYVFYYNMHHIISDGWSMDVLTNDVFTFYDAFKANQKPNLVALPIHYKDYSVWQLEQLANDDYNEHKAFWIEQLSGNLTPINLPSSKQRPAVKTYNGKVLTTFLNEKLTQQLKGYTQQTGGSLFMGLLSAWKILMYRYTGQRNIIVGSPVAGRNHADLEHQIGFYVNVLAFQNEIVQGDNFHRFYNRLKENVLQSYNHQMYPFDCLVEDLELQRDTSRSPVFDISMSYHNSAAQPSTVELSNEVLSDIENVGFEKIKNDIELHFKEVGNYMSFKLIYNTDVYDQTMIERLMQHYKSILSELLQHPTESIDSIKFLSDHEKQTLLVDFNNTKTAYPKEKDLVDLFQEQVEKTPDNVALVFKDKSFTYRELDACSNQLAHFLTDTYKIQPDDLIGVQLDRSEWMIISILGIMKAGGAYLPIDPEYPDARKEYITNDADLKLLITDSDFIYDIDYYDGELCALDIEYNASNYSSDRLVKSNLAENLAYVIYTSGSTGQPKGVMVSHKAIANTMHAQMQVFGIESGYNGLQFASFSFDASISESFIILLAGATLFVVDESLRKDADLLATYIIENKIDIATLPPSYLRKIEVDQIRGMQKLITAGEAAPLEKINEYLKYGTYFNAYGPTETSICGTIFKLEKGAEVAHKSLPIGQPIPNVQILVLDEMNELLPMDLIGEICIGGDGLAKGYLNQEELTQEKFIQHPFDSAKRLYKTGDLGRWLPDGNIEFVGRKDDQVKIRGYRIELGEIEQALLSNQAIQQAVVLALPNDSNENELAAYITNANHSDQDVNTSNLRKFLRNLLPEYMVPTHFVLLEEMPLTSNQKIDKKALPNPKGAALKTGVDYVAPQNEIEEQLVQIWEEVLQREKIGVKDNFFDVGGHSLKAIILINRIESQFEVKMKIENLLSNPTVEYICNEIKAQQWLDSSKESEDNEREIIEL